LTSASAIATLPKDEYEAVATAVFDRITAEGGRMPKLAYFARLRALPATFQEMMEICRVGDGYEILLDLRDDDDPYYGGRYAGHGSTVLRGDTFAMAASRNASSEAKLPPEIDGVPWIYCGHVNSPNTIREHACVNVFARVHPEKPEGAHGTWVPLEDVNLDRTGKVRKHPIIQSSVVYLATAINVAVFGKAPTYTEFLGDDKPFDYDKS